MSDRVCPSCGGPLPDDDPRRVYCSDPCRKWVHKAGGPRAAARLKDEWAREWEVLGPIAGPDTEGLVRELRGHARQLRELAGGRT